MPTAIGVVLVLLSYYVIARVFFIIGLKVGNVRGWMQGHEDTKDIATKMVEDIIAERNKSDLAEKR